MSTDADILETRQASAFSRLFWQLEFMLTEGTITSETYNAMHDALMWLKPTL